jgi:adenosylcobinamide-phosphate synthase
MRKPATDWKRRWSVGEPVALIALILDAAIGWPGWLYARVGHPVGGFARLIDGCERRWNRTHFGAVRRRTLGIATVLLLLLLSAGPAWLIQYGVRFLPDIAAWLLIALFAFPALAQRSLHDHVAAVEGALKAGDLAQARHAVGMIVGRDTDALDEAGVARAAIESLAESFCDGIVAPFLWLLLLGLPGVWAYKAINTADSLIGHREERWRAFGWAAARLDDGLNLAPARLGGVILCLAAGHGWRVMARDAHNHASPNAGWTEAAMAGALDLRLAGPVVYDGVAHAKPWIGDGRTDADAKDIDHALRIYRRACLILWLVAGLSSLPLMFRILP